VDTPIITLASSQKIIVEAIQLFPEKAVSEIIGMRAGAIKALGGVHSGVGFWGSPMWALGGTAALGIVEGLLSRAARDEGLRQLQRAEFKYRQLERASKFFPISAISNVLLPHPQTWRALKDGQPYVHNGDDFVSVFSENTVHEIKWSLVAAYSHEAPSIPNSETKAIDIEQDRPRPIAEWRLGPP